MMRMDGCIITSRAQKKVQVILSSIGSFISEVCNNDVDVTDSQAYISGLNIEKSLDSLCTVLAYVGLFYT